MLLKAIEKGYTMDQIFNCDEISIDYKHISQRTYFQRQETTFQNWRLQKTANFYKPPSTILQSLTSRKPALFTSYSKLQIFFKVNRHIYLWTNFLLIKFLAFDLYVTNEVWLWCPEVLWYLLHDFAYCCEFLQTCSSCYSLTECTMWPCREYLFIWSTQQVCLSENCPSLNTKCASSLERRETTWPHLANHSTLNPGHSSIWPCGPNRVKLYPPKELCFLEPWGKNCPLFSWVSNTKKNKSISVPWAICIKKEDNLGRINPAQSSNNIV